VVAFQYTPGVNPRLFLMLSLLPLPCAAASGTLSNLVQVTLALAVVLAAILAAAWLLRRAMPGQQVGGGHLKIVGGLMVGARERVVVVEVGDTWLLLGVAQGQVSLLTQMPRPAGAQAPDTQGADGFGQRLREMLHRRHG
jgi:flagellar protein FliO/FliZ